MAVTCVGALALASCMASPASEPEPTTEQRSALVLARFPTATALAQLPDLDSSFLNYHPFPSAVELADIDGDGDLDTVAIVMLDLWTAYLFTLKNDGAGNFSIGWYMKRPASEGFSLALADIDLDGDVDMAARFTGFDILENDGTGQFIPVEQYLLGSEIGNIRFSDLNDDGYPDILVVRGHYENSQVYLFQNNKDKSFGAPSSGQSGANAVLLPPKNANSGGVDAGDVDGDGHVDVVVNAFGLGSLVLFKGIGPFQFAAPVALPAGPKPLDVRLADIDLDGDLDLLSSNFDDGTLAVLVNTGGTFSSPAFYASGLQPAGLVTADVNGDCYPDALTFTSDNSYVSVNLNTGNGAFEPSRNYSAGLRITGFSIGDIDGDSDIDIFAGTKMTFAYYEPNANGGFSTIRNLGNGKFWAPLAYDAVPDPESLAIGEFNNDGRKDFAHW